MDIMPKTVAERKLTATTATVKQTAPIKRIAGPILLVSVVLPVKDKKEGGEFASLFFYMRFDLSVISKQKKDTSQEISKRKRPYRLGPDGANLPFIEGRAK